MWCFIIHKICLCFHIWLHRCVLGKTKDHTWKTVLARTCSVRCNKAWAFRLPEESISPINAGASCKFETRCNLAVAAQNNYLIIVQQAMLMINAQKTFRVVSHLVFAVIIWLQVLDMESVKRGTDSTKVESVTNLEGHVNITWDIVILNTNIFFELP